MTADSLRSAISDSAQNTTQLIQQSQAIIMEALQEYATTGDLEQLRSSMQSRFEILAGQIEASFTSISETVSDLDGETTRQFSEIHSFIRLMAQTSTVNGGIVIGESTSQIKLKLENDILYFFTGDEKTVSVNNAIAYFSAGKLYVVQSQIQQLTIGTTGRLMDFYILGSGENTAVGMIGRLT